MAIPLPTPHAVANLFEELLGRGCTGKAAPIAKVDPKAFTVAEFHGSNDAIVAIACCDIACGASLAAALTVFPPVRVDDCIKAKELDEDLASNLYENFNVLAAIFPQVGAPRVVLRKVINDGNLPEAIGAVLAKPSARVEMDLAVTGYKTGKFAIYAA
jgi:hypothetical protein